MKDFPKFNEFQISYKYLISYTFRNKMQNIS